MTDERKKQLVIGGAIFLAAIILLLYFRSGRGFVAIAPPVNGDMGTPGLSFVGPQGSGISYNIPPYVPPNAGPGLTINQSGPSAAPACPCPKVCEGPPMYYASELTLLNSNPPAVLQWISNIPMPEPEPEAPQSMVPLSLWGGGGNFPVLSFWGGGAGLGSGTAVSLGGLANFWG